MSDSLWPLGLYPARLLCPWNFSGKTTRVGSHSLLQGNIHDPEIELKSPALQVDSLLFEPPGKPKHSLNLYAYGWMTLSSIVSSPQLEVLCFIFSIKEICNLLLGKRTVAICMKWRKDSGDLLLRLSTNAPIFSLIFIPTFKGAVNSWVLLGVSENCFFLTIVIMFSLVRSAK